MLKPMMNKKTVGKNKQIKRIQKQGRKVYKKGDRKVLKNYIGKLVSTQNEELIGVEKSVSGETAMSDVNKETILQLIENAKLTGMSGNGYPVVDKMKTFAESEKGENNILIVNAVECEPGLKHDEWLLHHHLNEIDMGMHYISSAFSISKAVLAVKEEINQLSADVKICQVPSRFPMGEEHFCIQAVTGKILDKQTIPAKQGILVMNVQTVYQIYKLLNHTYDGKRFVTLANTTTGESRIAYVSPEDLTDDVLEKAFPNQNLLTFAGSGILRTEQNGNSAFGTDISFAALGVENAISNENKCKKCGACSKNCPVGIPVHKIVQALEKDENADISAYHPERCIKCGSCAYFCAASKMPGVYVNHVSAK